MQEGKVSRKSKLIADLTLILALLLVGLSVFLISDILGVRGSYAVVSVDGEDVGRYSLTYNGEYSLNEGTNTLVINEGRAYITSADCPDKVCVRTGKISKVGERIVCLPNRLEVRIEGDGEEVLIP